jgi:hypothetical protein
VHQEKKHEAAVNANMHEPPEKVLFQYPELEKDIKNKDPQQGKDLWVE